MTRKISPPSRFFIEVTNSCNLKCIMCRSHPSFSGKAKFMHQDIVEKILPWLDRADFISPFGFGEPFLYRNFAGLLQSFREKSKNAVISFNTNGQLLDKEKIEALVDARVNNIALSIDAVDKELYEQIRRGASFSRLCENIRLFNEIKKRKRSSRPNLSMEVVVMNRNVETLPAILDFARANGFRNIVLEQVRLFPQYLVKDYGPYHHIFAGLAREAHRHGIFLSGPLVNRLSDVFYPGKGEKKRAALKYYCARGAEALFQNPGDLIRGLQRKASRPHPPDVRCSAPWRTMYVSSIGQVRPCCAAGKEIILGDLNKQSLAEVWEGPAYEELRESLISKNYSSTCLSCIKEQRVPVY